MLLLLSAHFCALSWFSSLTVLEARYNARRIKEDGANNSLRAGFHTRRTIIRIVVALLLAAAASTATLHYLVSVAGLLAAMSGFFMWYFSPALNKLRGLPAYYVSSTGTTAWLDRQLWQRAIWAFPGFGIDEARLERMRKEHAAGLLRWLGRIALLAGLLVEAAALAVLLAV